MTTEHQTDSNHEQRLRQFSKQTLNDSLENIDTHTVARLQAIRKQVLHGSHKQGMRARYGLPQRWLLPSGLIGSVAAALLVVSFWFTTDVPEGRMEQTVLAMEGLDLDDMAVLSASEEPEFYQDLEFYQWLEEVDDIS